MLQFPELGRTYEVVTQEHSNLDYDLHRCVNCGNSRRDEKCMQRVQNLCAEMNWNSGWCRQQRDTETPISTEQQREGE